MTDAEAMARALALAWNGWGRVAPNPMVGAVLLRDGVPLAEGFHDAFGGPHAEAAALAACEDARGATCVVTLEPCVHHGKTPPCADALVARGVTRTVIAGRDPSPVARGGVERLRAAGIEVVLGVGAREAAALNAGYLWSSARPERPFVALKLATSVDGLIADADGRSQWISGSEARDWVQWLRAGFDAIAVGRHTAVRDDPRLTVRGAVAPRVPPARVVFAGRGTIPATLQCLAVDDARVFVVAHPEGVPVLTRDLAATAARVLPAATLADGLRALRAEDVRSVLVEGGGVLAGGLLDEGLVDRFYRITAPRWLGQGTPAFGARRAMPLDSAPPWEVVERRILGTDDLTVYDRELCLQGL